MLEVARSVYRDPGFEPHDAADVLMGIAAERAAEAKERAQAENEELDLTGREKEQRTRRAMRGAEREEVLLCLEELEAWYRDLVVVAAGAETAAAHVDRLAELREDATVEQLPGAEAAAEAVRETWRLFEELQLQAGLALEALFVKLQPRAGRRSRPRVATARRSRRGCGRRAPRTRSGPPWTCPSARSGLR